MVAAAAVFLALTGCETKATNDGSLQFNRPAMGEYFHDVPDQYYKNLDKALEVTQNPVARENIERLKEIPIAQWLNGDVVSTRDVINENLDQSRLEGSIPLFVLYNVPHRDLGGEAAGGAKAPNDYYNWVKEVSDTIGNKSTVVILEPDALAQIPNMRTEVQRVERVVMLHDALTMLAERNKNTAVYLDAGNSAWHKPAEIVKLIQEVDPREKLVGGISLNVSYQSSEETTRRYARDVSTLLGRPLHVMIDNSMNGASNTDKIVDWCNPEGEHIGSVDDYTYLNDGLVEEAYIKVPGESDGACGTSSKRAGEFDIDLLIRQTS